MIKAILIDDEPLARMIVNEYLQAFPEITVVQECNDGFEGVKAIQQHQPDLVFLDVQMPKINGFEMLELIDNPPAIIFTTAFDEYALKAFENNAVDYLLKPFSQERFDKALRKWIDQQNQQQPTASKEQTESLLQEAATGSPQNQRIVVKTGSKIRIIPIHEVLYLEADDDYVKVHTADGVFLKNKTMTHFEQTLDPRQFVRTHRSYIVNVQIITRLDAYEKESYLAVLNTGGTNPVTVPVSKTGYAKLKTVLGI
ncbi:LytR/AlgR family response regulator transcription factor [Pseudoflavitalea rhizosphaerae]|uniref:LytR/AlgR family response regulator transcription factor n=1 Tax=Pseudoflavitalea rhizosphaerae TaxID=1884793 RepID=UPI000F8EA161|nr:LytTR family transcriptional regulator DNA-binding domain-containing protein [Pseudoflavitalea rhizosphaerae]